MEGYYYKVSDGGIMDIEGFLCYAFFLKQSVEFVFEEWFCENDFLSLDAFNYVREILENDKRTNKFYGKS